MANVLKVLKAAWSGRKYISKALKALDGWKLQIAWFATLGVRIMDGINGTNNADGLASAVGALGLGDEIAQTNWPMLVADVVGVWATVSKFMKAAKQAKAGASMSELLTEAGYKKLPDTIPAKG